MNVLLLTDALGWTLLHFIWQGFLLSTLVWILLRPSHRLSSETRYWVAYAGMLAMVALSTATFAYQLNNSHASLVNASTAESPSVVSARIGDRPLASLGDQGKPSETSSNDPTETASSTISGQVAHQETVATKNQTTAKQESSNMRPVQNASALQPTAPSFAISSLRSASATIRPWLPLIVLCWCVGVGLGAARLIVCWLHIRRLLLSGSVLPDKWQNIVARLHDKLDTCHAMVMTSTAAKVPMVVGWLKPVVLIPTSVLGSLTTNEVEAILVHELVHIRRYDYMFNLFQRVIELLFFYHPAVWWLGATIRLEREHTCDALAASFLGNKLSYARSLTSLEELRAPTLELGVAANTGSLLLRLRRLLQTDQPQREVWPAALLCLCIVSTIVIGFVAPNTRATASPVEQSPSDSGNHVSPSKLGEYKFDAPAHQVPVALLQRWLTLEQGESKKRLPSEISEACLGRLRSQIDNWVQDHQHDPKLRKTVAELVHLRKWRENEPAHPSNQIGAYLNQVAATELAPVQLTFNFEVRFGRKLSEQQLSALRFGAPNNDGLRMAWSLSPRKENYIEGEVVSCSQTVQNTSDQVRNVSIAWDLDSAHWQFLTANGSVTPQSKATSQPAFHWRLQPGEVIQTGGRSAVFGKGPGRESDRMPLTRQIHAQLGERIELQMRHDTLDLVSGKLSFTVLPANQIQVWNVNRPGNYVLPGGMTMELESKVYHGADVMTRAILRSAKAAQAPAIIHEEFVAADFFGNHEPWAVLWELDQASIWFAKGNYFRPNREDPELPHMESLRKLDLQNPQATRNTSVIGIGPEGFVPAAVLKELAKRFTLPKPSVDGPSNAVESSLLIDVPLVVRERSLGTDDKPLAKVAVRMLVDGRPDSYLTSTDERGILTQMIRLPLTALQNGTRIEFRQNKDSPTLAERPDMQPIEPIILSGKQVRELVEQEQTLAGTGTLKGTLGTVLARAKLGGKTPPVRKAMPGRIYFVPKAQELRGIVRHGVQSDDKGNFKLLVPSDQTLEMFVFMDDYIKTKLVLPNERVMLERGQELTLDVTAVYEDRGWQLRCEEVPTNVGDSN